MQLESLLQYLDTYLGTASHPDYRNALNGLQVGGGQEVVRVAAAVDASEAVIDAAIQADAQLLLVHHGLFWGGLEPLTGRHLRKIRALIGKDMAVYSAHLPLDSHPEVGNCALLGRALGLEPEGRFGSYEGVDIGWWGRLEEATTGSELAQRLSEVLGGSHVHLIPGGPDRVERVGVVTGGGASFVKDAVSLGLDALVTGEGSHHTHFDAMELGIHVLFGGHYATETFGVRALAEHVAERFGLEWTFLDQPTGL